MLSIYKYEDHPDIVSILGNQSSIYLSIGEKEKALKILQKVLGKTKFLFYLL